MNPRITTALLVILLVGLFQAPVGICWETEVSAADCPERGLDTRGWRSIPRVGQPGQLPGTRRTRTRFGYFAGEARPFPAINSSLFMPPPRDDSTNDEHDEDDRYSRSCANGRFGGPYVSWSSEVMCGTGAASTILVTFRGFARRQHWKTQ